MKSPIIKRSIIIAGHKTSVSLENEFWSGLKEIARAQGATVAQTATEIDKMRQQGNLSSRFACSCLTMSAMAGLGQPAWTDAEADYVLAIRLSGRSGAQARQNFWVGPVMNLSMASDPYRRAIAIRIHV